MEKIETKTVTCRLDADQAAFVTNLSDYGFNYNLKQLIEEVIRVRNISELELKGLFSDNEWKFLADSLNGSMVSDQFRVSRDALMAHNEDAELYEGTATKWNISVAQLNDQCKCLSGAQVEAIYRRIERFWNSPGTDIDAWCKY